MDDGYLAIWVYLDLSGSVGVGLSGLSGCSFFFFCEILIVHWKMCFVLCNRLEIGECSHARLVRDTRISHGSRLVCACNQILPCRGHFEGREEGVSKPEVTSDASHVL